MSIDRLASLVARLAADAGAREALMRDPEHLQQTLNAPQKLVRAMRDADRFFVTEKPILDGGPRGPVKPLPPTRAVALARSLVAEGASLANTLVASADTGTLLSGPNTGTHSDTANGSMTLTDTFTQTATPIGPAPAPGIPSGPPSPATPSPFAPSPFALPPSFQPSQPAQSPQLPPSSEVPWPVGPTPGGPEPAIPAAPTHVCPAVPTPAPGVSPAFPQVAIPYALNASGCGCEASIVALVALVSSTAATAITAIATISRSSKR